MWHNSERGRAFLTYIHLSSKTPVAVDPVRISLPKLHCSSSSRHRVRFVSELQRYVFRVSSFYSYSRKGHNATRLGLQNLVCIEHITFNTSLASYE